MTKPFDDLSKEEAKELLKEKSKEELMELLEQSNPEMYRLFTSVIRARGDKESGVPDAFSFVRALQEYDKEKGLNMDKGLYTHMFNHYDEAVDKYEKSKEM